MINAVEIKTRLDKVAEPDIENIEEYDAWEKHIVETLIPKYFEKTEKKAGRWSRINESGMCRCSCCHEYISGKKKIKICPSCRADMEIGEQRFREAITMEQNQIVKEALTFPKNNSKKC